MIEDLNTYRNKTPGISKIDDTRYENIFKMNKYNGYLNYNIIKKIDIGDDLNPDFFYEITNNTIKPWTTLSFQIYGTQDLWWLICLVNKVQNPINNPELGKKYKIIKPDFVSALLNSIKSQL